MLVPTPLALMPSVTKPSLSGAAQHALTTDEVTAVVSGRAGSGVAPTALGSVPIFSPSIWSTAPTAVGQPSVGFQRTLGWSTVVFMHIAKGSCLSKLLIPHWPAASDETPASPDAIATVSRVLAGMNIQDKGNPAMPQTPHPLDLEVEELHTTRTMMVRLFASDGHIDEREREILERQDDHYRDIAGYRLRENAADSYKRNGASDLTVSRFKAAGHGLIDLDAERKSRPGANVISFPSNRQSAG